MRVTGSAQCRIQTSQPYTDEEEWQRARQPILDGWMSREDYAYVVESIKSLG